jgi:phosphatidylserine decarboxylase
VRSWSYADQDVRLKQGDEMGRFLLGSTVVMLFPKASAQGMLAFNPAWQPAGPIRLGEVMAQRVGG